MEEIRFLNWRIDSIDSFSIIVSIVSILSNIGVNRCLLTQLTQLKGKNSQLTKQINLVNSAMSHLTPCEPGNLSERSCDM